MEGRKVRMEDILGILRQQNDLSIAAVDELREVLARSSSFRLVLAQLARLPGNAAQYGVNSTPAVSTSLAGKRIAFLGSSVTFGYGALGESFVDYLAKRDGILPIKEAVSGTTLVDQDTFTPYDSYVARLANINPNTKLDAFVLQLSTNDAKGNPLGIISDSNHYDPQTITGAIETILDRVQRTWRVPVFVYTNPRYSNRLYGQMVDRLFELQTKWGFTIIDLYHNNTVPHGGTSLYMADQIHPTRAGYRQKWLPIFETALAKI